MGKLSLGSQTSRSTLCKLNVLSTCQTAASSAPLVSSLFPSLPWRNGPETLMCEANYCVELSPLLMCYCYYLLLEHLSSFLLFLLSLKLQIPGDWEAWTKRHLIRTLSTSAMEFLLLQSPDFQR